MQLKLVNTRVVTVAAALVTFTNTMESEELESRCNIFDFGKSFISACSQRYIRIATYYFMLFTCSYMQFVLHSLATRARRLRLRLRAS